MAETKTHKYIGQNYVMPDLVAKVTGKAKYAEDYKADGMLFAKLLLSPMPHARVTRIDTTEAMAPVGAGFSAVVNAISDAVGDEIFRRAPVTPDMILLALEHGRPMHNPLAANV